MPRKNIEYGTGEQILSRRVFLKLIPALLASVTIPKVEANEEIEQMYIDFSELLVSQQLELLLEGIYINSEDIYAACYKYPEIIKELLSDKQNIKKLITQFNELCKRVSDIVNQFNKPVIQESVAYLNNNNIVDNSVKEFKITLTNYKGTNTLKVAIFDPKSAINEVIGRASAFISSDNTPDSLYFATALHVVDELIDNENVAHKDSYFSLKLNEKTKSMVSGLNFNSYRFEDITESDYEEMTKLGSFSMENYRTSLDLTNLSYNTNTQKIIAQSKLSNQLKSHIKDKISEELRPQDKLLEDLFHTTYMNRVNFILQSNHLTHVCKGDSGTPIIFTNNSNEHIKLANGNHILAGEEVAIGVVSYITNAQNSCSINLGIA